MATLIGYIIVLFFIGLGNAVIIYHILRYRDPDDASLTVLIFYLVAVAIIIIGTALLVDWSALFPTSPQF